MLEHKKFQLFIQKWQPEKPSRNLTRFFFAIVEKEKKYPIGYVCDLPVNPEYLSKTRDSCYAQFPENLTEFATQLLVDAYYSYEKNLEIQAEIIKRLNLIWNGQLK